MKSEHKEVIDAWIKLIEPIFPDAADILHNPEGGYDPCIVVIDWPLNDDKRPNKRSQPIHLIFLREFLSDYSYLDSDDQRASIDRKIKDFVQNKNREFDPDHDVPSHLPVSQEAWTVPMQILSN